MKVSAVLGLVALALTASVANAGSLRQLQDVGNRMEKKDPDVPVSQIIADTMAALHPQHAVRMEARKTTRMESHKTQTKMESHKTTQAKMESHKTTQAKMDARKAAQAKMESHKTQAKMESAHVAATWNAFKSPAPKLEAHKTQAKMESYKAKMESHKTQTKMESHKMSQAKMESNHRHHKSSK